MRFSQHAFFITLLLALSTFPNFADAHEHKKAKGKVNIDNVWARATFALAKTGAVYLNIDNGSQSDITLLSVRVDSSVAGEAQLHETVMEDEMMQMRELESGIKVSAGTSLEFKPGGKHIMLMGLVEPLEASETFILTLVFENNKIMRVPVEVKDAR